MVAGRGLERQFSPSHDHGNVGEGIQGLAGLKYGDVMPLECSEADVREDVVCSKREVLDWLEQACSVVDDGTIYSRAWAPRYTAMRRVQDPA